jgi:nucleotide-binding universal stress UspA family protein
LFPTKILLAVDGSGEAALAARATVELASGTDSELHVVHVVSTVPELPYPRASARERSEALLEWKRLGGLKLLDDRVRWMEEVLGGASRRPTIGRGGQRRRSSVSAKSSTPA